MISRMLLFFVGTVCGSGLMYFVLLHHVIRANDGWHVVDKVDARLSDNYVDIREYDLDDWSSNPEILAAISSSPKSFLLNESPFSIERRPSYEYWDTQIAY